MRVWRGWFCERWVTCLCGVWLKPRSPNRTACAVACASCSDGRAAWYVLCFFLIKRLPRDAVNVRELLGHYSLQELSVQDVGCVLVLAGCFELQIFNLDIDLRAVGT